MIPDLTEEETEALARLLRRTIDDDRYPLSPRVQTLKAILAKIRPEPAGEPLALSKTYAPPRAKARQRRGRDQGEALAVNPKGEGLPISKGTVQRGGFGRNSGRDQSIG